MVSANRDAPGVEIGPIWDDFVAGSEHKLQEAAQFPRSQGAIGATTSSIR